MFRKRNPKRPPQSDSQSKADAQTLRNAAIVWSTNSATEHSQVEGDGKTLGTNTERGTAKPTAPVGGERHSGNFRLSCVMPLMRFARVCLRISEGVEGLGCAQT